MFSSRDIAIKELNRAIRYRKFVSLLTFDLSELRSLKSRFPAGSSIAIDYTFESAVQSIEAIVRENDLIHYKADTCLVLILPETDQAGAEAAGKRLLQMLIEFLSIINQFDRNAESIIFEITSFPDNANATQFQEKILNLFASN